MFCNARTGMFTARQLRDRFEPMLSVQRVQELLTADPYLTWRRSVAAPRTHAQQQVGAPTIGAPDGRKRAPFLAQGRVQRRESLYS